MLKTTPARTSPPGMPGGELFGPGLRLYPRPPALRPCGAIVAWRPCSKLSRKILSVQRVVQKNLTCVSAEIFGLTQSIEQIVGNPATQSGLRQITIGFMRIALFALAVTGMGNDFERIVQVNIIDTAKLLVGWK